MKEFKDPLLIVLVLFVLVGLAYKPLENKGLDTIKPTPTTETGGTNSTVDTDTSNTVAGQSPYYNKIRMSNISGVRGNDPQKEYFSLSTYLDKNETVKITGWYLKSEITGYYVTIGQASILPLPPTKSDSDVIIKKGDKVYITKGFSPINMSFRTNKCIGYLQENRAFYPGLYGQCPLPKDEKLPTFSNNLESNEACLDVIDRIQQCTTVSSSFIRDLPDNITGSCKTYLTNQINYNTCVALHISDTDFPGQEYRLYLNKFGPLWSTRSDKISLYDQNNLVVDTISW